MDILSLLAAFGLGSVISVFVQSYLARKSENNDKAAKNFAFWQMRCDLVAPEDVRSAIEQIIETNDNPESRFKAHNELKVALRTDLGIAK